MEKRIKDLTAISILDSVVSIPIDSTNFNKAMNVETTTLLKTTIDDADITNDYQLVTPTAIYNRYATDSKTGCVKLYSDGDTYQTALTPSDIDVMYNRYQIKKNYNTYLTVRGVAWESYLPPLITANIQSTDFFDEVGCNITTINITTTNLIIPTRNNSISFVLSNMGENIPSGTLCSITGYAVDNGNRIAVAGYVSNPLGYTPTFTVYATVGMFGMFAQFSANRYIPLYITITYSAE